MSGRGISEIYKANENSANDRALKRQRVQVREEGMDCFNGIAQTLHFSNLSAKQNKIEFNKLEVEIRLGMLIEQHTKRWKARRPTKNALEATDEVRQRFGLAFKTGVDTIFAKELKEKLRHLGFSLRQLPVQCLRSDDKGNRWEITSDNVVKMAERKVAVTKSDFALLAYDYDLRISTAIETPMPSANIDFNSWVHERQKRRISYTSTKYDAWQLDYTEVETISNLPVGEIAETEVEHEFEFEMAESVKLTWLRETDPEKLVVQTRVIATQFFELLNLLVPYEDESHDEPSLRVMPTELVRESINQVNLTLFKAAGNDQLASAVTSNARRMFDFVGSMPVNLSRQNLLDVLSQSYYVAEKSDGIRYLLYVMQLDERPFAVLINRSKVVYQFRGSEVIGAALGYGTILDGELVFNLNFRENVFLVFDVLLWRTRCFVMDRFEQRLGVIQELISVYGSHYAKHVRVDKSTPLEQRPLLLIRKNFVRKHDIRSLLSKMRMVNGSHVYLESERRHHKSDGIIFQPDREYIFNRNYLLLKWKWPELRSIDLKVMQQPAPHGSAPNAKPLLYLYCTGPDGCEVNCTKRGDENITVGTFDSYRLLADRGDARIAIAEVVYHPAVGSWSYHKLRGDKDTPNYIDSVLGVFVEQAESISIEELEYAINVDYLEKHRPKTADNGHSKGASHGDFEEELKKLSKQLVEEQCKEIAKLNAIKK